MIEYQIRISELTDAPAWLLIAREVEYLFGPMVGVPEFQCALREAITSNAALCASPMSSEPANHIAGGVVISIEGNSIEWLAVSRATRGEGVGRKLMQAALERLDPDRPIRVQTFDPSCPDGAAARHLYLSFGFRDIESKEPTPAGVPTVLMERPPCK